MTCLSNPRVILVTGANRGIGFVLVKKLSTTEDVILLGSRDLQRGQQALEQLNFPSNVHLLQLDTSAPESILRAVEEIKEKYAGQLDVLINNAALYLEEIDVSKARELFKTNYYGIQMLNECLAPLMRENGRIINVSSRVGLNVLQEASPSLREEYTSSTLTSEQLDQLVEEFLSSLQTNTFENLGYNPQSESLIYGVSKAALNALTQIEARQWSTTSKNLLIVSVTPGFCATDMTKHDPNARSPELGADSILHAVNTASNELVNGAFYRDGLELPLVFI